MTDENPYLAMRSAKIQRNQARLVELGLVRSLSLKPSKPSGGRKRPIGTSESTSIVRRRSNRLLQVKPEFDHSDLRDETILESPIPAKKKRIKQKVSQPTSGTREHGTTATYPPHSCRSISLRVSLLVDSLLGKRMEKNGKSFVIQQAFELCAPENDKIALSGVDLSFNKYSGVQPWSNDTYFLWVNLGQPNNETNNEFLEGGRCITWFGGARMHEDSAVIRGLIRAGKAAAQHNNTNHGAGNVILWCRLYEPHNKNFSPYFCLGRLSYRSHVPNSSPLAFTWNLLDYEEIMKSQACGTFREAFKKYFTTVDRS